MRCLRRWRLTPNFNSWPASNGRKKRGSTPEQPHPTPPVEVHQPASAPGHLLPLPRRWTLQPQDPGERFVVVDRPGHDLPAIDLPCPLATARTPPPPHLP